MRPGGEEKWAIKLSKTAEIPKERTLVKNYPFNGNGCSEKMCLLAGNTKNKIGC